MSQPEIIVERTSPLDDEVAESWTRRTDDPELRAVEAGRYRVAGQWPWHVTVAVAEFVRSAPLEREFVAAISGALRSVVGVTDVHHEDREVWIVAGTPSGEDLVRAVAAQVDRFAVRIEALLNEL
ncbi:MAG: hypothetical protein AAGA17_01000 [Actinomycetota bacterium]